MTGLPKATTSEDQPPAKNIAGLPITTVGEGPDKLKILIYAPPGMGKTWLAGSAEDVPEMRPMLYIDVEGGTETLRELHPEIQVVRVKTRYDKGMRVVSSAWKQLIGLYESLKKGDGEYRTVVVDNITEAYQLSLADVMADLIAEKPDRDIDVPDRREWGKASSQMRRWIRHMRDLDCNVIFTAHSVAIENDSGQAISYAPSFPGKLKNEVAGYVDMVLYLYTKQEKEGDKTVLHRKLQTQPAGKFVAKDRSNKLPMIMTDPTMSDIYNARKGTS